MGIRRYFNLKNWYSDEVVLLLQRTPCEFIMPSIKKGHTVRQVSYDNVADTQSFEKPLFTSIYRKMLEHGDIGIFGYIDDKCVCRLWGRIVPTDTAVAGSNLELEEDAIFVHYVETAKDSRKQGMARECLSYLIALCPGKTTYTTISLKNKASLQLHKSLGFKESAVIYIERRFMKTRTYKHEL